MGVMPLLGVIFNMCCCDSNTTLPFLGRFIDGSIVKEIGKALLSLSFRDGGGQCGLREGVSKSKCRLLPVNSPPCHDRRDRLYLIQSARVGANFV